MLKLVSFHIQAHLNAFLQILEYFSQICLVPLATESPYIMDMLSVCLILGWNHGALSFNLQIYRALRSCCFLNNSRVIDPVNFLVFFKPLISLSLIFIE